MNNETIIEGWLEKSPPDVDKTSHRWNPFKARWRRRYFVLTSVSAADSLPGARAAALVYYADPQRRRKRGAVNLTACDEVYTSLRDSSYVNVFALCTQHKRQDRVYLLAADSEVEMNQWINCLCYMLGMKENDNMPPVPPDRPIHTQPLSVTPSPPRSFTPPSQITPPPPRRPLTPLSPPSPSAAEGYIALDECYSDGPVSPLDLVPPVPAERYPVPREQPPPPPPGVTPRSMDTYDTPRPSVFIDDSLYNVPPVARRVVPQPPAAVHSWYDVPAASRIAAHRHSGSSSGSRSSGFESDPAPRAQRHRVPFPPPDSQYDTLPPRAPTVTAEEPLQYVNLAGRGARAAAAAATPGLRRSDAYDVPLDLSIEIPGPCGVKRHEYVNAPAGYVPSGPAESTYMAMSATAPATPISEPLYTDMSGRRATACPRTPPAMPTAVPAASPGATSPRVTSPGVTFLGVTSAGDASDEDIYSAPLPNRPVPRVLRLQQTRFHVPRPGENGTNHIFMTQRTKSFRRDLNIDCGGRVILPRRRTTDVDSSDSSSDCDTDSVSSHDVSSDNLHLSSDSLPPAPPRPHQVSPAAKLPPPAAPGEVQYLDLDIERADPSYIHPRRSPLPAGGGGGGGSGSGAESPTNYKEIDFVKTNALNDMKRALESERKGSEWTEK